MTRTPKDRALAQLAELEAKAEELRQFIDLYDELDSNEAPQLIVCLQGDADSIDIDESCYRRTHRAVRNRRVVRNADSGQFVFKNDYSTKEEIAESVRDILHDETEPMHINQLFRLVIERGIRINGQNPKGNLSAKMAPLRDIIYVKDKGWILKRNLERKIEQAFKHRSVDDSTNGNGSDRESLP